ncbi:MAG: gliding motility lipoprotein GldD [Bacteroidia bacterium]|nr:gliding motility lipoprotein GldD [Bacteroidia bacterium]
MQNHFSGHWNLNPFSVKFPLMLLIALSSISFSGCDESTYTPKPKGYFRIDLPEKKYRIHAPQNCPFEFEIPDYSVMMNYKDSVKEPCWNYLNFPTLNGEIFLSYVPVQNDLQVLTENSRTLAYKHTVKADAINEAIVETNTGVYGIIYDIGGNAASSVQFYATDSTKHFIRGALYFNVAPQPDSLAPVIRFLRRDIEHMLSTIRWK